MTQSVLEHVDEDIALFEGIRKYVSYYGESIVQMHLFPSAACLPLYLHHGIRQYTPRTILRFTSLFSNNSYVQLFELGGKETFKLQFEFFSQRRYYGVFPFNKIPFIPEGRKKELGRNLKSDPELFRDYNARFLKSARKDMADPKSFPIFYALVIHSNWKRRIYDMGNSAS